MSILGKNNALARAGAEPGCLLYLWISLGFSSENQEKSGNPSKFGSEKKKNLSRLKDYKGEMNLVKTTNHVGLTTRGVWAQNFPWWLKIDHGGSQKGRKRVDKRLAHKET